MARAPTTRTHDHQGVPFRGAPLACHEPRRRPPHRGHAFTACGAHGNQEGPGGDWVEQAPTTPPNYQRSHAHAEGRMGATARERSIQIQHAMGGRMRVLLRLPPLRRGHSTIPIHLRPGGAPHYRRHLHRQSGESVRGRNPDQSIENGPFPKGGVNLSGPHGQGPVSSNRPPRLYYNAGNAARTAIHYARGGTTYEADAGARDPNSDDRSRNRPQPLLRPQFPHRRSDHGCSSRSGGLPNQNPRTVEQRCLPQIHPHPQERARRYIRQTGAVARLRSGTVIAITS